MRSIIMTTLAAAALVGLAGCNANPSMVDISGMPPADRVEGIVTRIASRQQIRVYAKQPDNGYKLVHEQIEEFPDQSRLFATSIDAGWLANHKLTLSVNETGTLKKVETTVTRKSNETLTQTGTSIGNVMNAVESLKKKQESQAAAEDKAIADQEKVLLEYRTALEEVVKAQAKLAGLPPGPSQARVEAESSLRIRKLEANQAARRLKRSAPYPEADELP